MRRIAPFSSNDRKANATFCVFNGVNLLFGSYFFYEAGAPHALLQTIYSGQYATRLVTVGGLDGFYYFTHQLLGKLAGMAHPAAFLGFALGLVPLAFSLFFYAIPAIRARRLAARNERPREENMRRVAYRTVLDSPIPVRPESLSPARGRGAAQEGSRCREGPLRAGRLVGRRARGRRLLFLRRDRARQGRGGQGPGGRR